MRSYFTRKLSCFAPNFLQTPPYQGVTCRLCKTKELAPWNPASLARHNLEISVVPGQSLRKGENESWSTPLLRLFRRSVLYQLAMDVAQLLDVLVLYPHICPHTEIVKALLLDRRGFWVDAGPFSSQTSVTAIADTQSLSRNNSPGCRIENYARLQRRTHHPPHAKSLFMQRIELRTLIRMA